MTSSTDFHALIIGASGIIGWSVVNQLLQRYPSPSPFHKVTALVNRPLKLEDAFWPASPPGRPQLVLSSGVNLLCKDTEFEKLLKEKVDDITSVSHVYYFGKSLTYCKSAMQHVSSRHCKIDL
jgi:nucleoside-diphosphate-sugar epimerase